MKATARSGYRFSNGNTVLTFVITMPSDGEAGALPVNDRGINNDLNMSVESLENSIILSGKNGEGS